MVRLPNETADGTAWQRDSAQHFDLDLSRLALLNQSTSHIRKNGSLSNRRQEAEEEVVEGQGYVTAAASTHTPRTHKRTAQPKNHPPTHTRRSAARAHEYTLEDAKLTSPAVKDKAQHAVVLDKNVTDKLNKDVQSYRLITVATLVDRLKINGSLARKALKDLEANGQIKKVVSHSKLAVYSAFTQEGASPRPRPPARTPKANILCLARAVGDAE